MSRKGCRGDRGGLSPVERLLVAIYERALKDWIQLYDDEPEKQEQAYDALCWLMSDEKVAEDYFTFIYVCDALGWSPEVIRKKTVELFYKAIAERKRQLLVDALTCFENYKTISIRKRYRYLSWVLDETDSEFSFISSCRCFGLDHNAIRRQLFELLEGHRKTTDLAFLRNECYSTIN